MMTIERTRAMPLTKLISGASILRLRDGRALSFAEYGRRTGHVLFYFHGFPGSRLEGGLLAEPARRLGIRLIAIDRPGMGLSTFKPRRHFLEWPCDVAELADGLGIDRFSVLGYSGGGPYALACACKIPGRLLACGIVSGAGIAGPVLTILSPWLPWLLSPLVQHFFGERERASGARPGGARPSGSRPSFSRWWPEPDKRVPAWVGEIMAASLAEAFRQGSKGPAYEGTLLGGHWDFKPKDVVCRNVHWWHGALDRHVPIARGRAVAASLSNCATTFYPGEGHISLMVNHGEDVVRAIAENFRTSELRL